MAEVKEERREKLTPGYLWKIVYTILGFLVAAVVNAAFPQIASGVHIKTYHIGGWSVTMNSLYRTVLYLLSVYYVAEGFLSLRDKKKAEKFRRNSHFRFALGIALAVWDITGTKTQVLPQPFFPGPAGILEAFLIEGNYIWQNTLYSLRLFTVGFLLGVILGVTTGVLTGWFPKVRYWVNPVLRITGIIPAVAWMPFALTLFPTPFSAAVFLIVICVWFPVASTTAAGVESTPRTQFEAAKTLGASTSYLVFHVAIPHAMPEIFSGIGTANAFAFTTLVMAEMMGQPGGLGYYINASKVWSAYFKVFAAILVMAILFSLIMKVIDLIRAWVLRWQKGTMI